MALCRLQHVQRALDVGLPALVRVLLEHRQVLQRGGVERHLRPVLGEDRVHTGRVADVGKHDVRGVQAAPWP